MSVGAARAAATAAAAAGYCCGPYDLDGSYNIAMVAGL